MADRAPVEDATASPSRHEDSAQRLGTAAFDYPLDEGLIAQRPLPERDASRLLVVHRSDSTCENKTFTDIVELVSAGDVLVLNETRVFPARLVGRKPTGAAAELLLVEPLDTARLRWRALVRPGGKLKPGRVVRVADDLEVRIEDSVSGGARIVRLLTPLTADEALGRYGHVPLPPYIRREDDEGDRGRYQTVYARERGSVAAPTAGLHFTDRVLRDIEARGVGIAKLTLHVGPGTFRPVEVSDPAAHRLDAERFCVGEEAADLVNRCRDRGGAIWAVGSTTVRTLEAIAEADGYVQAGEGKTDLFIRPGHRFRVVDRLITNFHLPRSTLLMLVAAFAGYELTMEAYRQAAADRYRFYSYGDAMAVI
jgi:S-adenosylmethionine:tRNA ribosyltransferase-isomerase